VAISVGFLNKYYNTQVKYWQSEFPNFIYLLVQQWCVW